MPPVKYCMCIRELQAPLWDDLVTRIVLACARVLVLPNVSVHRCILLVYRVP